MTTTMTVTMRRRGIKGVKTTTTTTMMKRGVMMTTTTTMAMTMKKKWKRRVRGVMTMMTTMAMIYLLSPIWIE